VVLDQIDARSGKVARSGEAKPPVPHPGTLGRGVELVLRVDTFRIRGRVGGVVGPCVTGGGVPPG